MKVTHRLDLEAGAVTLDRISEVQDKFCIPLNAIICESEETYTLVIEWEDSD